jgi:hypothetical protein
MTRNRNQAAAATASGIVAVIACLIVLSSVTVALFASERPVSADLLANHRA